jgi:hypothetical protein
MLRHFFRRRRGQPKAPMVGAGFHANIDLPVAYRRRKRPGGDIAAANGAKPLSTL